MKKLNILISALLLGTMPAIAQNDIVVHDDNTNKDEVIDLPIGMTANEDSLLTEWKTKFYLVPDTNCTLQDVNPFFEKEVYINRLQRIPSIMEMPYNAVVQKFIDQYATRLRRSVSYMLGACNFYIPIFEEALDLYQLPLELKYLPIIESALDPRAKSRVGAVGLWQFMLKTAKNYDLKTNSLIDERCDPVKSSFAAARYLRDLYTIYGDWNLVIAAYNCGPIAINKAIHRADGSKDYWKIYPYLPRETRGYVPAFIAANYIMNYYCEHNICPMKTLIPIVTDTIVVSRDVHFEQISALCHISVDEVKSLNPQYRTGLIPGRIEPYPLRLPLAALNLFIDAKDSVYNYQADLILHKRKTVEIHENEIEKVAPKSYARRSQRSRSHRSRGKHVTIRQGQTLSEIAKRNGTTVSKLKRLNGIKGSSIRAGKKLKVK
ncbi:MAG: transglycosylase SLT domain-containing protein [Bacteroidaceae bacterium]